MLTLTRKTYKYRLLPTCHQENVLGHTLGLCRELYNAALQHRRDAYRIAGKSIGFAEQSAALVECKQVRPDLADVYSQTLQEVLHRVDRTFKAFFARVKRGDTLRGIAQRFGVSRAALLAVNDLGNPPRVSPGQVINIPVA